MSRDHRGSPSAAGGSTGDLDAILTGGYDVGSGALSAVSASARTVLNDVGLYETRFVGTPTAEERDRMQSVSAMSSSKVGDESMIAAELFGAQPGIAYDPVVGHFHDLYVGFVAEGDYRRDGSSGGFGSWILSELLRTGDVDHVIHVAPTADGADVLFDFTVSSSPDDVAAGSKSRYYPVQLDGVLRTMREQPGRYAVVGIPSVIFELRLLAAADAQIGERLAFTVGLVCGHQKSTKYAESFAWQCGIKPGDLRAFDFRVKVPEGRAWDYRMEMTGLIDGDEVTIVKRQDELFGSDWGLGFFKAKFSDFTDDAFNETADVVVGDAWLPEYDGDPNGTNVVIVRDARIAEIVNAAIAEGRLSLEATVPEKVHRSQRGLVRHTRDEIGYRLARADAAGRWRPSKRYEAVGSTTRLRRRIQRSRTEMAEQSHIHYARAVELGDWEYFHARMTTLVRRHERLYAALRTRAVFKEQGVVVGLRSVAGRLLAPLRQRNGS